MLFLLSPGMQESGTRVCPAQTQFRGCCFLLFPASCSGVIHPSRQCGRIPHSPIDTGIFGYVRLRDPHPLSISCAVVSSGCAEPCQRWGHTSQELIPILLDGTKEKESLWISSSCLMAVYGSATTSCGLLHFAAYLLAVLASSVHGSRLV